MLYNDLVMVGGEFTITKLRHMLSGKVVAACFVIILIVTTLCGLLQPLIFQKTYTGDGFSIKYPTLWYASLNANSAGDFESLVISDVKSMASPQQAIDPLSKAQITINLAPKDSLENYAKYEMAFHSPKSIVSIERKKVSGHDALKIIVNSSYTDSFYSKEILLFIDDVNHVYRVNGGALRNTRGILADYEFAIVEGIIDSIRLIQK